MPVTPFHLGPAVLVRAAAPRWFSLGAFAAVQVVMDVEPVANVLAGRFPLHGPAHTLLGSVVIAAGVGIAARRWLPRFYAAAGRSLTADPTLRRWIGAPGPVTWPRLAVGALLGAVSHVALDAVIHADVRPLAPWTDANALLVAGSFGAVHAACLVAGVAGLLLHAARRR